MIWYLRKYREVGSLAATGMELAHKEVHKDLSTYTVAGTRPAKPEDWERLMRLYNFDLVRLFEDGVLRNGKNPSVNWCACYDQDQECAKCLNKRGEVEAH